MKLTFGFHFGNPGITLTMASSSIALLLAGLQGSTNFVTCINDPVTIQFFLADMDAIEITFIGQRPEIISITMMGSCPQFW